MLKLTLWVILHCIFLPSFVAGIDSFSTYERAERFHNNSQQQWGVAFEALNSYTFKGNESVIEIGCRSGRVAANLAGRIPKGQVTATEIRGEGAILFAKKNHSQQLYPNLKFLDQDFLKTDYVDKFDLAVAFCTLHWHQNQEEILKKVYQALKPGGRILFTIPGNLPPGLIACLELIDMDEWKSYFEGFVYPRVKFTPEEYKVLLEGAGFKSIEITVKNSQHYFENRARPHRLV